MMQLFLDKLV